MSAAETEMGWQTQAECLGMDPSIFFPERGDPLTEARKACARCPVSEQCLDYALDNRLTHGIWGGKSERERQRIRKQRLPKQRSCVICNMPFLPKSRMHMLCGSEACALADKRRRQKEHQERMAANGVAPWQR